LNLLKFQVISHSLLGLIWQGLDAIEKAGIQDFGFHDLRHTFASSGTERSRSIHPMGHSSFTMNATLCSSLCGKPSERDRVLRGFPDRKGEKS